MKHVVLRAALAAVLSLALVPGLARAQAAPSEQPRKRPTGPAVSATELTIRVESPSEMRRLERELARTGARIRKRSADGGAVLVEAPASVDAAAFAAQVAEAVPVSFAEPAGIVAASLIPTDPDYRHQWGLPVVDAPEAWDHSWGSADVVVAVIDSGVEFDHPDLKNRLLAGGWDFVDDDAIPQDGLGHGTGVAGIVVAEQDNGVFGSGVAPGVRVLPIRVLGDNGLGLTFDVAQAVRYATDHGADVINLSLGSEDDDAELSLALQYAFDHDVVIVAASGNSHPDPIEFPARVPGVIAVGAIDQSYVIGGFSCRGPELDFVAPGVVVYSTAPGGRAGFWTGTSAASPMVAGSVALLLSHDPDATIAEIESALRATARDLGPAGRDDTFGNGVVQVGDALKTLTVPAPTWLPVYRFFNAGSGTHFYTPSAAEAAQVRQRYPHIFIDEGVGYEVSSANGHPLYRFFNTRNGSHFYTASLSERNEVRALLPHVLTYEGETYSVALSGPAENAVFRFFNRSNGSHFYTASVAERDIVRTSLAHIYSYEGPAFYRGE